MSINIYTSICPKCQNQFTKQIKWGYIPKYCSRSCSSQRKHSSKTKAKISYSIRHSTKSKEASEKQRKNYPFTKLKYCPISGRPFPAKSNMKYHWCVSRDNIKLYRSRCKFKLNNRDYPSLFKTELIEEYGWYQPSNSPYPNLTGVCWDHLYRIEDGFHNNISPEIISHPANAEMVTWPENKSRLKSQITLEELYQKISQWDN